MQEGILHIFSVNCRHGAESSLHVITFEQSRSLHAAGCANIIATRAIVARVKIFILRLGDSD